MLVTEVFNVNEEFKDEGIEFDKEYTIVYIPAQWLPMEFSIKLTQYVSLTRLDPDEIDDEALAKVSQLSGGILADVVRDWNLTDQAGNDIAVPSDDEPDDWKKVPQVVLDKFLSKVLSAAADDDIPLANETPSSDNLTPPEQLNRQQRRALERASPSGSR